MKSIILILTIISLVKADFLLLSDIHFDMNYTAGSPTKCVLGDTGMGCCRPWDIPINNSIPAPIYGSFGCDTPQSIFDILFPQLQKFTEVDFAVFLGDAVDHDLLYQTEERNLYELATVGSYLSTLPFPVFSILGNHDSFLVDNLWDDNETSQIFLQKVQGIYNGPSNLSTTGYYAVTDEYNRRLLFMNCLGYDKHNIETQIEPNKDLFNQTAWFQNELQNAKNTNQTVLVFHHFSVNVSEAIDKYNDMAFSLNYTNLWFFSGHTHSDQIRMSNSTVFYINPSIMPDDHWPEFRIVREKNGKIVDYEQYGLNLTTLQIQKIYSALNDYELSDLSTTSWVNFFERMSKNETLQALYCWHQNWGAESYVC